MKRSGDESEIGESASASPGRGGEVECGRQWKGCVGDAGCLCFDYGGEFLREGRAGGEVDGGLGRD